MPFRAKAATNHQPLLTLCSTSEGVFRMRKIPFSPPDISQAEIDEVVKVMNVAKDNNYKLILATQP